MTNKITFDEKQKWKCLWKLFVYSQSIFAIYWVPQIGGNRLISTIKETSHNYSMPKRYPMAVFVSNGIKYPLS